MRRRLLRFDDAITHVAVLYSTQYSWTTRISPACSHLSNVIPTDAPQFQEWIQYRDGNRSLARELPIRKRKASGPELRRLAARNACQAWNTVGRINQTKPMLSFSNIGKRKWYDVMVSVVDEQKRRVGTTPLDSALLCTAIQKHAEAASVAVLPLLGGHFRRSRRQPRNVGDVDLLVSRANQKTAAVGSGKPFGSRSGGA
jgi:hypothetical protein